MKGNSEKTKEITVLIDEQVQAGIIAVINGKKGTSFKIQAFKPDTIPVIPARVIDFMVAQGWEAGEMETNGWEYDWWIPFTKDGLSFTASGSGYYGGFGFHETETP